MELLKELLKYAGFGSVTLFLGYLAKKILEPILKKCLDFRLEKAKIHEKSIMDMQATVFSKKLEIESIKLNRALPSLEKINFLMSEYGMMFNTYLSGCINNGGMEGLEEKRFEIDSEIIKEIYKISIYLPEDMRFLLNEIRRIISCSWIDPKIMFNIFKEVKYPQYKITEHSQKLYFKYHNCFYQMVYKYCLIENEEVNYKEILKKFEIIDIKEEPLDKFIKSWLLLPEYYSESEKIHNFNKIKVD